MRRFFNFRTLMVVAIGAALGFIFREKIGGWFGKKS